MMNNYRLIGKLPVPCSFQEGTEQLAKDRHVALTYVGDCRVSTVFLVVDHNLTGSGPPHLFETMIFGGEKDGYQARCSTWDEAQAHHVAAVEVAKSGGGQPPE